MLRYELLYENMLGALLGTEASKVVLLAKCCTIYEELTGRLYLDQYNTYNLPPVDNIIADVIRDICTVVADKLGLKTSISTLSLSQYEYIINGINYEDINNEADYVAAAVHYILNDIENTPALELLQEFTKTYDMLHNVAKEV